MMDILSTYVEKMFCNGCQFLRNFHFVNFSHTKTDYFILVTYTSINDF